MTDLGSAYRDFIREGFCTLASIPIAAQEMFYSVFSDAPDVRGINAIGGAYSAFCNRPPPPSLNLERERGQCPVKYRVNANGTVKTGNQPAQNWTGAQVGCTADPDLLYGPITGPYLRQDATGTQQIVSFNGKTALGDAIVVNVATFPVNNGLTVVTIGGATIARCDGQPDDCGSIIPPPNPPGTQIFQDNRTFIDNQGNTTNVDLDLTIPVVYVNVNGQIEFKADVKATFNGTLDVDVPVTVNIGTGDISFNVGGDLGDNRTGEDDTDYDTPDQPDPIPLPDPDIPDPDTDDTDEPGTPSRRVIKGVHVIVSSVDTATVGVIAQENTPNILIPCAGYVSFLIATGLRTGWTTEIPVKSTRSFIPCPWEGGAIDVRFSPRGDTVATLSPVTARFQPDRE